MCNRVMNGGVDFQDRFIAPYVEAEGAGLTLFSPSDVEAWRPPSSARALKVDVVLFFERVHQKSALARRARF